MVCCLPRTVLWCVGYLGQALISLPQQFISGRAASQKGDIIICTVVKTSTSAAQYCGPLCHWSMDLHIRVYVYAEYLHVRVHVYAECVHVGPCAGRWTVDELGSCGDTTRHVNHTSRLSNSRSGSSRHAPMNPQERWTTHGVRGKFYVITRKSEWRNRLGRISLSRVMNTMYCWNGWTTAGGVDKSEQR